MWVDGEAKVRRWRCPGKRPAVRVRQREECSAVLRHTLAMVCTHWPVAAVKKRVQSGPLRQKRTTSGKL